MTGKPSTPLGAVAGSTEHHIRTRSLQQLMGLVTGIVADEELKDIEISLLSTWLSSHPEVTSFWPGSAIASNVRAVLQDGVVTDAERVQLLATLTDLVGQEFAQTGSPDSSPTSLPTDDSRPIAFSGQGIVHTGTFFFGTRPRCEALSAKLGAVPLERVTRQTGILVIGGQVTPSWITESYGRKIMAAAQMRDSGHPIHIVSEQHWLQQAKTIADI